MTPGAADTLELASRLVMAALAAGADDADVYLRRGPVTRFTLQQGRSSESIGLQCNLALRVWSRGRLALLTAGEIAPAGMEAVARRAVQEARERGMIAQPWLHDRCLAHPRQRDEHAPDEHAPDEHEHERDEQETVTASAKRALLEQLLAAASKHWPALHTILNACYSDSTLWTALVNSRGFASAYQARHYKAWLWVEGAAGHLIAAAASRRFARLCPTVLEQHLEAHATFLEQPSVAPPGGPCQVLLPPSVAADLARSLGALLAAENVLQNLRPLLSHLDQPIASPAVTLVDDGALADGLKSQPIDDEGTATTATTLIERGRLRALLHTLQSADQLGVAPNGKAMRLALWKQPRSVPSNIYVQGGDATPEQLRGQLRRGLAVMSTPRPGRIHPATGKFTVVAQGWWVEDGELVRPVHGVPLSANIFDLLRNVTACGTDLHFSPLADGAGAPSVLIERMQVG